MSSELNKKYKRPKKKTLNTTNPETSTSRNRPNSERLLAEHVCPLLAKDSEWVDILQTTERSQPGTAHSKSSNNGDSSDEEEVLQLVECEDGPQSKPLAIMFPGLLDKDPQTLTGMLNKAMSTTEVTRQLVDLGQKANFSFMKKADRLIPTDKQWLESVTENTNSVSSFGSSTLTMGSLAVFSIDVRSRDEHETWIPTHRETLERALIFNPSRSSYQYVNDFYGFFKAGGVNHYPESYRKSLKYTYYMTENLNK